MSHRAVHRPDLRAVERQFELLGDLEAEPLVQRHVEAIGAFQIRGSVDLLEPVRQQRRADAGTFDRGTDLPRYQWGSLGRYFANSVSSLIPRLTRGPRVRKNSHDDTI